MWPPHYSELHFLRLGSSGDTATHDASLSQSAQNLRWTDASLQFLSNGGAIRADGLDGVVKITHNFVKHCLRGIRVQECAKGGIILDDYVKDVSEAAIYLNGVAATTKNILVQNNQIINPGNNGVLLSSVQNCSVMGNNIIDAWNDMFPPQC